LTMQNIIVKDCGPNVDKKILMSYLDSTLFTKRAVVIDYCSNVNFHNLKISTNSTNHGLLLVNVMKYIMINQVTCNGMILVYNDTQDRHIDVQIINYTFKGRTGSETYRILLLMHKYSASVYIHISNTEFIGYHNLKLLFIAFWYKKIDLYNITFSNCTISQSTISSLISVTSLKCPGIVLIDLVHCLLINNTVLQHNHLIDIRGNVRVHVSYINSEFYKNLYLKVITFSTQWAFFCSQVSKLLFSNTTLSSTITNDYMINASLAKVYLDGPVRIANIHSLKGIIAVNNFRSLKVFFCHGQIKILHNIATKFLFFTGNDYNSANIIVKGDTNILIQDNIFSEKFVSIHPLHMEHHIHHSIY